MKSNFKEHKERLMQNAKFKEEYEKLSPEYELQLSIVKARHEQNLTQKELAEKAGLKQAHISRLESGDYNSSIKLLSKIAKGLGKKLRIDFI